MSQRTHLGRSTAGCTILYLIKEMKPKIQHLLHCNCYCTSTAVAIDYAHNISKQFLLTLVLIALHKVLLLTQLCTLAKIVIIW